MGNKWRVLLIVLVLALGGVLAGCKGTDQSSAEGKAGPDSKVKLSWMAILYHQQPPKDRAIKEIEKLTNTELDITWVPDAVKEDRLNAALAAGNLPQIVTIQDIKIRQS